MAKKPKIEATLVSIQIKCGEVTVTVPVENASFYGSNQECEMCGSHGYVEINVTCPNCGGDHTIRVREW